MHDVLGGLQRDGLGHHFTTKTRHRGPPEMRFFIRIRASKTRSSDFFGIRMRDFLFPTIPFLLRFRAPSKAQRPSLHSSQAGARGRKMDRAPHFRVIISDAPPRQILQSPYARPFWGSAKRWIGTPFCHQKPSPRTPGNVLFYKETGLQNAFLRFFRDPYARLSFPNHPVPSAIPGACESTET